MNSTECEKSLLLPPMETDKTILIDIVNVRMPFGKYKGWLISDLPIEYLLWMKEKEAMPKGRLGILMENVYEMKYNDLYQILSELKNRYGSSTK